MGRDLGKENVSVRRRFAGLEATCQDSRRPSGVRKHVSIYVELEEKSGGELTSLLDHFESGAKEDPWCSTFQYSEVNLEEDDEQGALAQHQRTLMIGRNAEGVPLLGLGDEGLDVDRDHA